MLGIKDPLSKIQIEALETNCEEFGVTLFGVNDPRQGIVHVIGPEQGITQPGMTIVCGDSHTATHGAFWALAFGIWTSEVEHVLATQTLAMEKPKTMKVEVIGDVAEGVGPKDIIFGIIRKIGTGVSLIVSITAITYTLLLTNIIEPDFMDKALEISYYETLEKYPEALANMNMREYLDAAKPYTWLTYPSILFFTIVLGFVYSVILGFIIKSK